MSLLRSEEGAPLARGLAPPPADEAGLPLAEAAALGMLVGSAEAESVGAGPGLSPAIVGEGSVPPDGSERLPDVALFEPEEEGPRGTAKVGGALAGILFVDDPPAALLGGGSAGFRKANHAIIDTPIRTAGMPIKKGVREVVEEAGEGVFDGPQAADVTVWEAASLWGICIPTGTCWNVPGRTGEFLCASMLLGGTSTVGGAGASGGENVGP